MRLIFTLVIALTAEAQVITLERKSCFGMCQVYTLRIDASGIVSYHGERFVSTVGYRTGKIDPAKFQELLREFQKIGFFQLRDEYTAMITDMPTTFIGLAQNGRTKRIRDYYNAPPELKELEHSVDRAANVHPWIHDLTKRHTLSSPDSGPGLNDGEDLTNDSIVGSDAYHGNLNSEWTPLMYAAVTVRPDEVDRLLRSGANPNQQDPRGNTALIGVSAVRFNVNEVTKVMALLIAKGAAVNQPNSLGETALMWAAKAGHPEAITLLLNAGANRAKTEKGGRNALHYLTSARASSSNDPEQAKRYDRAAAALKAVR